MKKTTQNGGTFFSVLIALLFLASLAFNALFLSGCLEPGGLGGWKKGAAQPSAKQESVYLREIAARLEIDKSVGKTPGDIAFDIGQRLEMGRTYRGAILSEESFEKACAAIRIPADRETFKAYHEFISEIAGKTIIVLDRQEAE